MDEAIPAVEGIDVGDASHIPTVVLVVFKIVLLLEVFGLGSVFKGSREVIHTLGIINCVNVDHSRTVDVDEHFPVHLIVFNGGVPERVHHEDIPSGLQYNFLVKERKSEMGAEASIDEFSAILHENNIEFGGLELDPGILLAVIPQTLTLLKHGDSECSLVEVNCFL